ncbi:MAG: Ig-like domain-containing protein, partial [Gammaproteobacteria bacterium]
NNGIDLQTIALSSALGNTIVATDLVTDPSGQVSFDYTADNAGNDLIAASALGEVASQTVVISDDLFTLEIAGGLTEIPLNTPTDVTVTWIAGGAPVVGGTVAFAGTAGTIVVQAPPNDVTDGAGQQTVSISSTSAGPVLINATGQPSGPTTSVSAEFVATVPAAIELQAEPLTVATGDQSTLSATVTDADSNPVKNITVNFSRLQDPSAGSLSSPTGVTDQSGRATTVYTSGQTPTGQDDVIIEATVQGTAILAQETLTVARKELFISLGTGNDLDEPNTAQFRKEWVVQVTDADGNAVSGVAVQVSLNSLNWFQGCYYVLDTAWVRYATAKCLDEDTNRNGVLDVFPTVPVDEDTNGNTRIEAGNIALVSAQGGIPGQAANVVTDATGSALVDVLYPQSYHGWVEVEIEAKASVSGTETRRSQRFVLDAKADDLSNTSASPPGQLSPFGENTWNLGANIDLTQNSCTSAPEDPDPIPGLCPPPPPVP